MTTSEDFDRQLRALAHRAVQEMSTTPRVERRVLTPRRRLPLAPLALALGVAAAIGIAVPLIAGHSLRGGTAGPTPNEAKKPASVILTDMRDAMRSLHSYHVIEHGVASDGTTPVTLEVRTDHLGAAEESTRIGDRTNAVIVTHGVLYAKGPDIVPQEFQAAVGTHWYAVRDPNATDLLATLATPDHIMDCLTGAPGALTTTGIHIVNGVRTVRLVSTQTTPDTVSYTVDVAVDGPAYAVHFETDAGPSSRPGCSATVSSPSSSSVPASGQPSHQTVDFDDFNAPALVQPPNRLDVVDESAVAQPTN